MQKKNRVVPIRQEETHECILACVAMLSSYHGKTRTLAALRSRFPGLSRGGTLRDLMGISRIIGLGARAVRAELDNINQLALPCILHWNFNHFVVLEEVTKKGVVLLDPANGRRKVDLASFSRQFTGIAVELAPLPTFFEKSPSSDEEKSPQRLPLILLNTYKAPITIFVVIASISMIFSLVTPLAIQIIVDEVIAKDDRDLLVVIAGAFLLANLISAIAAYLQGRHLARYSAKARIAITHSYIDRLLARPLVYFQRRSLGTFVAQFNSLSYFVSFFIESVGSLIADCLFAVILSLALLVIDPRIAALTIGVNISLIILRIAILRTARRLQDEEVIARSQEEAYFVETMRGIASVKANMLETSRISGNLDKTVRSVNASFSLGLLNLNYNFALQTIKSIETILCLYWLALSVVSGTITVGVLYTFQTYRQVLDSRLTSITNHLNELLNLKIHHARLGDVLEGSGTDSTKGTDLGRFLRFNGEISFEGIVYRADNGAKEILSGFTASAKRGAFIHVSGKTGAGKTTLLKIFLGAIPPNSGQICIDGIPITQQNLSILRNSVGVVLQEDTLFRGTILENVGMFDFDIDFKRVEECCRLCCISEEIDRFPLKYQSEVSDIGANLSTGQQQRLLLARALYRKPTILVLDEATANLDSAVEKQILENIKKLNITVIFASHSRNVRDASDLQWQISPNAEMALSECQ
ncbi:MULTISPECIES: peptidase domain-containing ABC transporter [unclassified Ensifer]|uniref:peptidase domain-containing ABC transporter n=1 Tax=unclassified Ensifer TaxID=2633371 RepID=UPI00300FD764